MKSILLKFVVFASLFLVSAPLLAQTDSAAQYFSIRGVGVRIIPPKGFLWTSHVNGTNYGGFVNDEGARILVMKFPGPAPKSEAMFDSDFVQNAHGAQLVGKRDVTIDGNKGFEHLFRVNTVFIEAAIFGDTGSSVILEGIYAASAGDSMLAAIRAAFASVKWNPNEQLSPSDLDFSVITRPPFTRASVDQQYITYTPEDTAGSGGVPSLVVAHIPAGAGDDSSRRKSFATSLLMGNKAYDVEKIDTITDMSVDSLPAVRIQTAATSKASGRKLEIYMCVAFDASSTYVIEGVTADTSASTNIPIFSQIASTFKRREEYSSIIDDAIDLYKKRKFKESLERAARAAVLYPDSAWAFYAKALDENVLGLYSDGLADIDKSVALDKDLTGVEGLRAQFEEQTGDNKAAEKDYAAALAGVDTADYFTAARFHFAVRQYDEAAQELRTFNLVSDEPYAYLWLYFAEWKSIGVDSAAAHLRNYRDHASLEDKFCGEIIRYLLGELPENELIQHSQFGLNQSDLENYCEANFYAGMNNLLLGSPGKTITYWQKTIDTGVTEFIEYMYARAHMPK